MKKTFVSLVALVLIVMNKKLSELEFVKIFVQPASSDRGLSLGCALYASNLIILKLKK